jgi:mono/diheme cytochrome c family protein
LKSSLKELVLAHGHPRLSNQSAADEVTHALQSNLKAKIQGSLPGGIALVAACVALSGCARDTRDAARDSTTSSVAGAIADLTISKGPIQRVLTDEDFRQRLHLATVEVEDPVYLKRKRFSGYWLSDIFDLAGIQFDRSNIWMFSALDGYQARIAVTDVINSKAKPFVAVRDLDAPGGWERIKQGKEWLSPAPFYLVWQTQTPVPPNIKLPWPYQMAAIQIRDVDEAQQKLFPKADSRNDTVTRGFETFRKNCLMCHSLNLEGGVLGPELNVPKNILEYRETKMLKEFIANPSSFRAKSKMPAFGSSGQSLDDVLSYLAWIGQHKVPAD